MGAKTSVPIMSPTMAPMMSPTVAPYYKGSSTTPTTMSSTAAPTTHASKALISGASTLQPSTYPAAHPTKGPTAYPSTHQPSMRPTFHPTVPPSAIPTSSTVHNEHLELTFGGLSLSEMQDSSALQLSMWEAIATVLDITVADLSNMEISAYDSGKGASQVFIGLNIQSAYDRKAAAEVMSQSKATLMELLIADATANGYQYASSLNEVKLLTAHSMTDNPTPAPSISPTQDPTTFPSASPSVQPSPFPSLHPSVSSTLKPTPLPSTAVFSHCSVHITIDGLSEYSIGGSAILQKAFRGALSELLNVQLDDISTLTLTPITLTDGPGVMIIAQVASFYDTQGTAELIMDSNNLLVEDFVTLAVADGYTESLAGIKISGVSGLFVHPTVEPTASPTPDPSPQPSAPPTFQPSPIPTTATPTTQPSPFPTVLPTPLPSTNPTPQPTSQAMDATKDFTAAGLLVFVAILFGYLFYNYFFRRNGRGGSPDTGGYTSLSEIELGRGEGGDLSPVSTDDGLPHGALRSTPGIKDRVKKKVAEYIKAATDEKASPMKRSSVPKVKPTDEMLKIQLTREDSSKVWGMSIQTDSHLSHGHQIVWVAGINPNGAAMKAQPPLKVGDIIHKMDDLFTDQIDYTKHLQGNDNIEITVLRQLEEKAEEDSFGSFFARLFPSTTESSHQLTNNTETTPLTKKDTYDGYSSVSSPSTTMTAASVSLSTSASVDKSGNSANEEYEKSKRERELRLAGKASSKVMTPTIAPTTVFVPTSAPTATTKSAMDEYEESKRERERRVKMKSVSAPVSPDTNTGNGSGNDGKSETLEVTEDRTTEVLVPSQRKKALESSPRKASLKKKPLSEDTLKQIRESSTTVTTYDTETTANVTKVSANSNDLETGEIVPQLHVNTFAEVVRAALMIQKAVRGRRGRISYKEKIEGIPHTMVIGLETATGLQLNNDFLKSEPNTYILANLIRRKVMKSGRVKEYCFSSHASKLAYQSISPCYAEDIKVTTTAVGTLVLTIMSQYLIGRDAFHGQVCLNIEDYEDLSNGGRHHFQLPIRALRYPVYDVNGRLISMDNRKDVTGELTFTVDVPPIADNIAGWWFDVTLDPVTGQCSEYRKLWVVLRGDDLLCYDDVFECTLLQKVSCLDIIDVEKKDINSMEIKMEGIELNVKNRSLPVIWCYGDDSNTIRGIWLRALKRHAGKHLETMSEYERSQLERQKRLSNARPTTLMPTSPVSNSNMNTPKTPQEEYEESIRERKRRLRAKETNSFDGRETESQDGTDISALSIPSIEKTADKSRAAASVVATTTTTAALTTTSTESPNNLIITERVSIDT